LVLNVLDIAAMLDTSIRLLRLLTLLQARRYWPGPELAGRLDVTARTLRRDIDRLRGLGYPVQSSSGPAGGYSMGAGTALPPLMLEDDEVLAVVLGLRLAAIGAGSGMEESGLRALAKLEQVMPARLRRRARGLHSAFAPLRVAGPPIDADRLSTLANACRDEVCVTFNYTTKDGRSDRRNGEPHALVSTGSRWYLVCWDRRRSDWRTFRVDRIEGRITTGTRFLPRPIPGGDAAAFVSRSVSTTQYAIQARLILHAPIERMKQYISPLTGQLARLDDARCLLECGAHSAEWIAIHLAAFDVEFEVLKPPELGAQLREMAARLLRSARRETDPGQAENHSPTGSTSAARRAVP
jgi:predicted DNA-binding transcriptional regulator YafY